MDPLFEILLDLETSGTRETSKTLYRQLEAAILDGRLVVGAKLPPTRGSQAIFRVSRNTVLEVYDKLRQKGLVVARRGSGSYVADRTAVLQPKERQTLAQAPDARLNPLWLSPDVRHAMGFWQDQPSELAALPDAGLVDFRPALVDSRLFPHEVFRRISAKQLRGLERKPAALKSAQGNQGNYRLREAIVNHIGLTRAVVSGPDSVLVTSGAQQAFDLLARTLVIPNETVVAIEDPGYPPMRAAFAAAGARLVPVGVDEEGLLVDAIPVDAGVICVTPSHQFPLGAAMSMARRASLLAFAHRHGAVIIEDDYDGEFRYGDSPMEALRTGDAADTVFYVGTFSKCMLPALRLGFIIAPDWAMPTLTAAKNCLDWHCSTPVQLAVAGFIGEGHLTHHVRKVRDIYKKRRRLLLDLLREDFGQWFDPIPSFYGMHIAAFARLPIDLERVTQALLVHNVKLHSLDRYYCGEHTRAGLVFGYGAVDLPDIRRGMALLRQALLAAA
ncbi:MAG: GntR family transcriptional regulator [Massilia sp.]|nr:GntR family transcriptional regulator [Massilia sp.]